MLVGSSSDETDPDATGDAALVIYHPDGTPWLTVSAADLFKNARVVNPMRMGAELKRAKLKVEREFTPDTTEVPKNIEESS